MLVNLEPFGRLGNRLFLAAHLIAFSRKTGFPLLNLGFGEYCDLFPWFEGNASFAYPWRETGDRVARDKNLRRHLWSERMPWSHRFRYWGSEDWNFDVRDLSPLTRPLSQGKELYFRSWLFRGPQSLAQHRDEVLKVFSPPQTLIQDVEEHLARWRQGRSLLVGVHVRWEDYRGTPHFIDQVGFLKWMQTVSEVWPGRVRFVLFSNETLPDDGWGTLDWVRSPATSPLFDLTAMARCDYLMGPPSTFSGWASFSGSVPLLTLSGSPSQVRQEDFEVLRG